MPACPKCPDDAPLTAEQVAGRRALVCGSCGGQFVAAVVLRQTMEKEAFRLTMAGLRGGGRATDLGCPSCGRSMERFALYGGTKGPGTNGKSAATSAHGCKMCQQVWFDKGARPAPEARKRQDSISPHLQTRFKETYVASNKPKPREQDAIDRVMTAPFRFLKGLLSSGSREPVDE